VEEVGSRPAASGHAVAVYCRRPVEGPAPPATYLGIGLNSLPALRPRSLETLRHTALSVADVVTRRRSDVVLVFNSANEPLLPLRRARRVPVATHVDGLEWKRAKWGRTGQRYYRLAEPLAVRWSDALIADAPKIARHYERKFGAATVQMSYRASTVERKREGLDGTAPHPRAYHLAVARFEPENHILEIVRRYVASHTRQPLVVVGGAPYSDAYTRSLHAAADSRVRFLGPVWDRDLLDQLYANATVYWHGPSVGGTNPSLLRAIGAGAATNAFDVDFNRDVLHDSGPYRSGSEDVTGLAEYTEASAHELPVRRKDALTRAADFDLDDVAQAHGRPCEDLRDWALLSPELTRRPKDRRMGA
jgi:glycosyltransferase involved in cell wall biosynthesis